MFLGGVAGAVFRLSEPFNMAISFTVVVCAFLSAYWFNRTKQTQSDER